MEFREYYNYYLVLSKRAFSDTWQFAKDIKHDFILGIIAGLVGVYTAGFKAEFTVVATSFIILGILVFAVFLWNLLLAPARIDEAKEKTIISLQKEIRAKALDLRVSTPTLITQREDKERGWYLSLPLLTITNKSKENKANLYINLLLELDPKLTEKKELRLSAIGSPFKMETQDTITPILDFYMSKYREGDLLRSPLGMLKRTIKQEQSCVKYKIHGCLEIGDYISGQNMNIQFECDYLELPSAWFEINS